VTPTYDGANHDPTATLRGSPRLAGRPGDTVHLQGVVDDPDEDTVDIRWWRWEEVDTYPGQLSISDPAGLTTTVTIPADAVPGQTIQLVLEATDRGTPPLTRYQRVVVTIARTGSP
jgi:hypothetical protein